VFGVLNVFNRSQESSPPGGVPNQSAQLKAAAASSALN